MNNNVCLTIAIPTYNRKEGLCKMLKSILRQGHTEEYQLLILDNHSNYDVRLMLCNEFSEDFANSVEIRRWIFNIGMATNISMPFLWTETKWLWLLSDDDEISDGAIQMILNDIKDNPNVLAIKYSLEDEFLPNEDIMIESIDEFSEYYNKDKRVYQMMYLSNVYNIEALAPYLSDITTYSYTHISFILPILRGLIDHKTYLLSSKPFVKYNNYSDDNWAKTRFKKVLLGYSSFADIDLCITTEELTNLHKAVFSAFNFRITLKWILTNCNRTESMMVWKRLYPIFNTKGILRQLVAWLFVYFYYYFNINPQKLL